MSVTVALPGTIWRLAKVAALVGLLVLPQAGRGSRRSRRRLRWAFARRSLMAAEIFVTVLAGLASGQLLHYGRELQAMDQLIGAMRDLLEMLAVPSHGIPLAKSPGEY